MAIFGYKVIEPIVGWITDRLGDGVETAGQPQPAPARVGHHRAGQGAVPQQRDQPRRADAARRSRGRRSRASRSCSCWRPTPGPGAGLLLAYLFFGPRSLRPTVPAAMIIQFFGGIHEIYFPYVLMKPKTDPRHHRRRRLGHRDLPGVRRRAHRPGGTGQLLRLHGRDAEGRLLRRDPRHRWSRPSSRSWSPARCSASASGSRRRRRGMTRHRADQGRGVGRRHQGTRASTG